MALYVLHACAVWPPVHRAFTRGEVDPLVAGLRTRAAGCTTTRTRGFRPQTYNHSFGLFLNRVKNADKDPALENNLKPDPNRSVSEPDPNLILDRI